jgi:para-aminobenzoate synthetase component 1
MVLPQNGYVISASPERFIRLNDQEVTTCPIKGTRKRSNDPAADLQLALALKHSEKDLAEHIMIVDLMRNDLSKVCQPHSVHVEELTALKSFTMVHHLVSNIKGTLKNNHNAFDLLKATFPPGSVTGAPKIRAMEIISELEKQTRGPYCGCLAYISFTGDMDSSVMIRSYFLNDNHLFFSTGGAVVMDSNPDEEYQETLLKAEALINGLSP